MKKILIKEIDIKFTGECMVSEFLIYYIVNGENINAYIELGEHDRDKRVNLIKTLKGEDIIIEEVSYEKYIKQMYQ